MTSQELTFHLALRDLHAAAGASFVTHSGWSLPQVYTTLEREHAALRSVVAIMDRSARSRFLLSGTDALDVLRATFAGHIEELEEGRAMRAVRLDERGEIRDIVLIARTGGISYLVAGEPSQRFETAAALKEHHAADFDVRIDDRTESTCLVSIAGPRAAEFVQAHLADALPSRLQLLHCVTFEFHGFRALATRTSDTGEDGFELMLAPAVAQHVIETLVTEGAPLAGFAAQEAARVESCIPAFDPDLVTGLSPAEAELESLLEIPGGRQRWILAGVLLEPGATQPSTGTKLSSTGERAGELRSVTWSPSLQSLLALAVVEARFAVPGRDLDADGSRATIVSKPFYRRRS